MKARLFVAVLSLVTILGHVPIASGQNTRHGEWAAVIAQPPGTRLSIRLKTGKSIEGTVNSVSETALQMMKGNTRIDLDRSEIKRIYRVTGRQTGKSTLIGLGIGAGAGVAVGGVVAATDGPTESGEGHLPIAIIGAVGAVIGTVTGFLTGLRGRKKVLIYEA